MTQPEPHGYPDWGRFAASADKLYEKILLLGVVGQHITQTYFVGDVPYIGFHIGVQTNNVAVAIGWAQDAAFANGLWNDSIDLLSGTNTDVVLPVKAPFMRIVFTPNASPYDIIATIASRHVPGHPLIPGNLGNVIISSVATPIAAGATVALVASVVYPGPAVWSIQTALAAWNASIGTFDFAAVLTRIDLADQISGNPSRRVFLPPAIVRIGITNNTGAAGTFSAFCSVDPQYSGS